MPQRPGTVAKAVADRLTVLGSLVAIVAMSFAPSPAHAAPFENSMAQRVLACTGCHGKEGRAGPDGYYPRIAGKPAGYLANQLLNFRDGRRHYALMNKLVAPLSDAYLAEIAAHFASLDVAYPPPAPSTLDAGQASRAERLVRDGDAARGIPACMACHGTAMTGVAPFVPGLLGLPRDYLNAQLGAWRSGKRVAQSPDCMHEVAAALSPADVEAVAGWLASRPVPADAKAAPGFDTPPPRACGGVNTIAVSPR